ncbi:sugar transferase [Roseicitreum antarcticum]|uniref:sugar transferase n=1 Tax=Roseicitreum antarcticum TaxID=564137 RepID=UPI00115FED96|nr:sugar transferase [Roseicitreum antarcticum]
MSKRVFDTTCILLMLPVVGLILALAAAAIKLTSRGPVLFVQHRYGAGRVPFKVFKLRTMRVLEDGDAFRQACKGDARITPVGRFLRKASIDELPQVFNVLRGDMSLVGPRPHATRMDDEFATLIPGYNRRFEVVPGITGLAQVRGQRGVTDTLDKMQARIASDIEYVETHGFWRDLGILLRTLLVVLGQRNAG